MPVAGGEEAVVFCPQCGEKNPDGARFCARCGSSIRPSDIPAARARGDCPTSGRPRRRLVLGVACGALALVAAALVALVVVPWFGARRAEEDRSASNASLSGQGPAVSADDAVYFYSTAAGGVCRANPGDATSVEVVYPVDNSSHWVTSLAWDASGGRVLFVLENYMDEGSCPEVHSIAHDGSADEVIYVGEPRGRGFDTFSIQQMNVFSDTLYLLVTQRSEAAGSSFDVIAMSPDGSDQRQLCHGSGQVSDGVIVTSERVYYVDNHYDEEEGGAPGTVYSLDYGGSSVEVAYQSEEGRIADIALGGGNLYVWEIGGEDKGQSIAAVSLDGSDARPIYVPSGDTGVRLLAADERGVYVESYAASRNMPEPEDWDLLFVSADGVTSRVLAEGLTIYNPTVNNMGSYLIMSENGQYQGSVGERVVILGGDGTPLIEYQLDGQGTGQ